MKAAPACCLSLQTLGFLKNNIFRLNTSSAVQSLLLVEVLFSLIMFTFVVESSWLCEANFVMLSEYHILVLFIFMQFGGN